MRRSARELWGGRRATAGPSLKIVAKSLVNVNVISLSTWQLIRRLAITFTRRKSLPGRSEKLHAMSRIFCSGGRVLLPCYSLGLVPQIMIQGFSSALPVLSLMLTRSRVLAPHSFKEPIAWSCMFCTAPEYPSQSLNASSTAKLYSLFLSHCYCVSCAHYFTVFWKFSIVHVLYLHNADISGSLKSSRNTPLTNSTHNPSPLTTHSLNLRSRQSISRCPHQASQWTPPLPK
jgi:hypothetical protein